MHLAHGQQNVHISQAAQSLLDLARISALGIDRVRSSIEPEAFQDPGKLLSREGLGRSEQLTQIEILTGPKRRRMSQQHFDAFLPHATNLFARPVVPDHVADLGDRDRAVFALGRRIVDHLVASGEPQFVTRRDQNGLTQELPGKYLGAVEGAVVQQLRHLNSLAEHDDLAGTLLRLHRAHHKPALHRARVERRQLRSLLTPCGRVEDEPEGRCQNDHRRLPAAHDVARASGPCGGAIRELPFFVPRLVSEHGRVLSKR